MNMENRESDITEKKAYRFDLLMFLTNHEYGLVTGTKQQSAALCITLERNFVSR
jgi:hypothetical protein